MSPLHEVMLVVLATWLGLFIYLWRLDLRIREVERHMSEAPVDGAANAPTAVIEPAPGQAPKG